MQSIFRPLSLALLLGLTLSGAAHAQQNAFDFVYQESGQTLRGTITELGNTEISINTGTRVQTVDVPDVTRITFASEPAELRAAREHVKVGQYTDALEQLEGIDLDDITREEIRQDVAFYKALAAANLALSGRGNAEDATQLVSAFIGSVRDSGNFHYYEAVERFGDLQVLAGNYDRAAEVYRVLEGGWPELRLRSLTLQAKVLQLGGNYQAAADKYGEVIAQAPGGAAGDKIKSLAMVGQAACLAELGNTADAIEQIEDVISNNTADQSNVELFARAYNGLGAAYRLSDKPQEALLAYLHVDLLFNGSPEAHAEALYYLSTLWGEARQNDRAVRSRELLRQRYSTSPWANR